MVDVCQNSLLHWAEVGFEFFSFLLVKEFLLSVKEINFFLRFFDSQINMNEEYICNIQTKSGSEKKAIYHTLEIWKLGSWFASSSLQRLLFLLQMQETLLTWRISKKEVDSCVSSSSSRSESSVVPSSAIKSFSLPLYGRGKKQSKVGVNNTNTRSSESENNESSGDYSTQPDVSTASGFAAKNGNVLIALFNASHIWSFFVLIAYISIWIVKLIYIILCFSNKQVYWSSWAKLLIQFFKYFALVKNIADIQSLRLVQKNKKNMKSGWRKIEIKGIQYLIHCLRNALVERRFFTESLWF